MPAAKDKALQAEVAERLRVTREALALDKAAIAADLSISKQRWYNYEAGKRPFDIDIAVRLCRTKSIPIEWLFMGDSSRLPPKLARAIRRLAKS